MQLGNKAWEETNQTCPPSFVQQSHLFMWQVFGDFQVKLYWNKSKLFACNNLTYPSDSSNCLMVFRENLVVLKNFKTIFDAHHYHHHHLFVLYSPNSQPKFLKMFAKIIGIIWVFYVGHNSLMWQRIWSSNNVQQLIVWSNWDTGKMQMGPIFSSQIGSESFPYRLAENSSY